MELDFATTGRAVVQLAAWYRKPLYQNTALWLGRARAVNNSAMSRSRFSLAGMRMAYFTPRSPSASYISGLAKAESARNNFLAQFLLPLDLGKQEFFPAVGAADVAGPQRGLEVAVVRAILLLTVH